MNAPVTGLRAPLLDLLGRRASAAPGTALGRAAPAPRPAIAEVADPLPDHRIEGAGGLSALWARRWRLVAAALLAAGLAAGWAFGLAVPRYLATAVLLSSTEEAPAGIDTAALPGLSAFGGSSTALNTEVEILRSRRLAGRVADRLNLVEEAEFNPDLLPPSPLSQTLTKALSEGLFPHLPPALAARARAVLIPAPSTPASRRAAAIDRLMAAVSVRNIPDSLILEVTAESAAPDLARRIADTLVEVYLADQARSRSDSATEAAAWLADRVEGLDRDLARAEGRLAEFTGRMNLVSAESLATLSARLKELRQRIAQQEEAEGKALNGGAEGAGKGAANGEAESPRLRQLRGLEARLAARHAGQAGDLAHLTRLEREVAASRLIHAHFLGRLKETAARAGAGRAESRLLAAAETPLLPAQPRPLLAMVLAATLGLLAMAARVMLAESGRQGLRSLDELEAMGLPVLGQTLARRRFRRTAGPEAGAELSAIAAGLLPLPAQGVRTGAESRGAEEGAGRLLMFTASLPGEGHGALARALVPELLAQLRPELRGALRAAPRVLLIEAGRGGRLCTALERATAALSGHQNGLREGQGEGPSSAAPSLLDGLVTPAEGGLRILGGRPGRRKASAGLPAWRALLEAARRENDLVILVAPPVLTAPLAPLLAPLADAVIHAVAWEHTPVPVLRRALRRLWRLHDRDGALAAMGGGLVLTGVDRRRMRAMGHAGY
ncbi:hypothetical protein BV394_16060 (plasmid) [Brevirhabdus pacifica]|uniref:Uncharacterized protein n=1 Tax=Brevirhabdus pacifica TaxID=1267768 RepID=A0A1P8QYH3_9RHOB|nr:Wzz/FepE/Etk N-terminal domain-containing protein [Brevirhabdus pacifica]APX91405.1 hypothetical protein BV394_16060 [Brevirhabdus pacifica]OWU74194.1 hypothetical protein ATO5_14740 [Loktanella sp. 22II-4b]PJJ78956.1 subunit length determinant protein [Brevirhabdus pacifica]